MKRLSAVLLALCAAAAPVSAAPITFTASLSGLQEEPSNSSPGTGFTTVTIDPVAHTLRIDVSFSGLVGTTTAAHIHVIDGPNDANQADTVGPVFTTIPTFPGFPTGVTAGSYLQTFDTLAAGTYNPALLNNAAIGGSTLLAEQALFAGIFEGRAYLNIHSTAFPGGEIRGFLAPAAVPEPAALLLMGTGWLAWRARRLRKG